MYGPRSILRCIGADLYTQASRWLRQRGRRAATMALALLVLVLGGRAEAIDGAIEINAACAAVGCFKGDSPGYPVTISAPGRYVLTSDLAVADIATTGIRIEAFDVNVDLNGYTLSGPNVCTGIGSTLACTATTGGDGVSAPNLTLARIRVQNGTIRGFGYRGIDLNAEDVRIERVTVLENGSYGVRVGLRSRLELVTANRNQGIGIIMTSRSKANDCTADENGDSGIKGFPNTAVTNSAARNNGYAGISMDDGSLVVGNLVAGNANYGLRLKDNTGYGNNVIVDNFVGTVYSTGTVAQLDSNVCNGTTVCP